MLLRTSTVLGALALTFNLLACSSDDTGGSKGEPAEEEAESNGENPDGVDDLPPLPDDVALPIVFVHGFAGSAQQYQSQAMRFAANGYPADRIRAFDHDGAGVDYTGYADGVDGVIDGVLAEYGVDKVYLVGHSRGTSVSSGYMGDPARAAKVAKYISLDGFGCAAADAASIPCIAPNQGELPGQAHVEVATSKECFAKQYEFLVGSPPEVVDIVPQRKPVVISGRAVNFPANTGRDGTTLQIWELEGDSGERAGTTPIYEKVLGPDGDFGPVTLDSRKLYEKVLFSPGGTSQHIYAQRYPRSSTLARILSGAPDAPSRVNANITPDHANLIVLRMREWYATDDPDLPGDESDVLEISTERPSGGAAPVNAIQSFVANGAIALHIHDDAATPKESSLSALPFFSTQPFQTGVDVYMPAAEPADGTITVKNLPRGDASAPQVLRFPNWSAENHTVMVMFSDYAVD